MFEASVTNGGLWKKIIECMKDLVTEANFDCSPSGVTIQAMDSSHVALVHLLLHFDGFAKYSCERNQVLGINLSNLAKVLKITESTDTLTLRHVDDGDVLTIHTLSSDTAKTCEFQMKLMEIEGASLVIPEMEYLNKVSLPATEFAKIVRDMSVFGDTVTVHLDRNGVKFSSCGDIGEGFAFVRAGAATMSGRVKKELGGIKKEEANIDDDEDTTLADRAKKVKEETKDASVEVTVEEPIALSFALRFFNIFGKGSCLSDRVTLYFAKDSPCLIEYKIEGMGYLRYYLAPKLDETE